MAQRTAGGGLKGAADGGGASLPSGVVGAGAALVGGALTGGGTVAVGRGVCVLGGVVGRVVPEFEAVADAAELVEGFGEVVSGAVVEGATGAARGRLTLGSAAGLDLCTSRAMGSTRRGRTAALGAAARLVKAPATVGTTVGVVAVPPLGAAGAVAGRTMSRLRCGLTTATPFSASRRGLGRWPVHRRGETDHGGDDRRRGGHRRPAVPLQDPAAGCGNGVGGFGLGVHPHQRQRTRDGGGDQRLRGVGREGNGGLSRRLDEADLLGCRRYHGCGRHGSSAAGGSGLRDGGGSVEGAGETHPQTGGCRYHGVDQEFLGRYTVWHRDAAGLRGPRPGQGAAAGEFQQPGTQPGWVAQRVETGTGDQGERRAGGGPGHRGITQDQQAHGEDIIRVEIVQVVERLPITTSDTGRKVRVVVHTLATPRSTSGGPGTDGGANARRRAALTGERCEDFVVVDSVAGVT